MTVNPIPENHPRVTPCLAVAGAAGLLEFVKEVFVYFEDSDAACRRALAAGATSLMDPADQFHGDRYGGVTDPFDNQWWMASRIEELSPEEMKRREEELLAGT